MRGPASQPCLTWAPGDKPLPHSGPPLASLGCEVQGQSHAGFFFKRDPGTTSVEASRELAKIQIPGPCGRPIESEPQRVGAQNLYF